MKVTNQGRCHATVLQADDRSNDSVACALDTCLILDEGRGEAKTGLSCDGIRVGAERESNAVTLHRVRPGLDTVEDRSA